MNVTEWFQAMEPILEIGVGRGDVIGQAAGRFFVLRPLEGEEVPTALAYFRDHLQPVQPTGDVPPARVTREASS